MISLQLDLQTLGIAREFGAYQGCLCSTGLPAYSKWEKVECPVCILEFLGIVLDTDQMEVRLPSTKAQQLQVLVEQRACRKREMLSLIGKLADACKVLRVGQLFLRRMIDHSAKAKKLDHWSHLISEFRVDLAWWQSFLPMWNQRSTSGE